MKIKQISQATGLTEKTIRYYEKQGLIAPQSEEKNGKRFRDYSETDLQALHHIAALRRAQFTVDEIRTMQRSPEAITALVEQYQGRMEQVAAAATLLAAASKQLTQDSLASYQALADGLEQAVAAIAPPDREITPHFGRYDPEKEERALEKRRRAECLRIARNDKNASIVFYNMTAQTQNIPANRAEAAGITPNIVQRLGIVSALREEFDDAKQNIKKRD